MCPEIRLPETQLAMDLLDHVEHRLQRASVMKACIASKLARVLLMKPCIQNTWRLPPCSRGFVFPLLVRTSLAAWGIVVPRISSNPNTGSKDQEPKNGSEVDRRVCDNGGNARVKERDERVAPKSHHDQS